MLNPDIVPVSDSEGEPDQLLCQTRWRWGSHRTVFLVVGSAFVGYAYGTMGDAIPHADGVNECRLLSLPMWPLRW